jgi:uncharacterized repeat protein (TIGR03803 family)
MKLRSSQTAVGLALCAAMVATGGHPVHAQAQYDVLASFSDPPYPVLGRLLESSTGRLYGVTSIGGPADKGAVLAFDRQPDGTLSSTVLHTFSGADGASPGAGLIECSDGALYGTTFEGGAENRGTVFRITPAGSFTLLHSFTAATGRFPSAELVELSDGNLYGTAGNGGAPDETIFRISKAGTLTVLHVFGADARNPQDALIDGGDGKLYGITREGGAAGTGAFFSITPDGTFTVLQSFALPGPAGPNTLIDGGDGFFYGGASSGESGKIFRVSRTGVLSVLYSWPASPPDGPVGPVSLVRAGDGNFYGTTQFGGSENRGRLFRVTPAGGYTMLRSFVFATGGAPFGRSLVQLSDGGLYGVTTEGGIMRRGTIFRATTTGQYTVVHAFPGTDPAFPLGSLIADSDGTFYGTSCLGGAFNAGTVFRVVTNPLPNFPVVTVLHSFAFWDGYCPRGELAFGLDGALYGTASQYGLGGRGTIFRITTAGAFSPVYFFNGANGGEPLGGLLRASDGHLYGTTRYGGSQDAGTLFRLTSTGAFSTLHHFQRFPTVAAFPGAPLMQFGNALYGAALGTPFRVTLGGPMTLFGEEGFMLGPFVAGSQGELYGTSFPSMGGGGRLFSMTPDGVTTTLHSFGGNDGTTPVAGLLAATDGYLYGSAATGGAQGAGTLYRYFPGGALETVHEFSGPDGAAPFTKMKLGVDFELYGSTVAGGPGNRGVIFKLTRPQ